MTKVVDLREYRTSAVEQRGFGPWKKRFAESFDSKTGLADLSDATLYFLAQPGEPSTVAYYEIVMGVLDLGQAAKFNYIHKNDQMSVVDLHLFLADQVRFELMKRLKWITNFEGSKYSLLEMIEKFQNIKEHCRATPPELSPANPGYLEYDRLIPSEKEVFVRRMLLDALDAFKQRV